MLIGTFEVLSRNLEWNSCHFQPSVRGLFSAIASVRHKLDNIMPTLTGAEEAVQLARKFLIERINVPAKRRDSNVSIMSSISQFGEVSPE